jgi:hypothetical protein
MKKINPTGTNCSLWTAKRSIFHPVGEIGKNQLLTKIAIKEVLKVCQKLVDKVNLGGIPASVIWILQG